jgi:hypothetical protein
LICKQLHQQLQNTFQTFVIKANILLKIVLSVTFRWKHWVMFTVICGMGLGETACSVEMEYHAYGSTGWDGSFL